MRTACFVALTLRSWILLRFVRILFIIILGTSLVVGSGGTFSWSSDKEALLQQAFAAGSAYSPQIKHGGANLTENHVRRRRSSDMVESADLPPNILTASHLSSLRDLVSDKKITVRLGLRVSLSGPSELLDPQLLLSLGKEPGIYNTGGKTGVFSMRVVGIKRVTSSP
ncbi:hypothetical protein JOB18_034805 [Solea senegalensis]|uniref:Uncharacterized protein n=1 Tax=Solea senegalensis TaxID=28829 RepID=A0AAV6S9B6_SOLSE|nr:hypothetical protein JOB18_034805 [Solea senegalensis]